MPRIAWIEDDVHIIGSVMRPLEKDDFEIDRYTTIAAATADIERIRNADLVLLDVVTGLGDGAERDTQAWSLYGFSLPALVHQ